MNSISGTSNNNISRQSKLKELGLDENLSKRSLNDKLLDQIYDQIKKNNKEKEKKKTGVHVKKPKTDQKVDKNDDKYILVLEFLNAILVKIGKEAIDDITKFKDIKRDDLLKPECTQVLSQYLDKIIKQFGKTKILYDKKDKINNYLLTVIKSVVANCGYQFKSNQKNKYRQISERNYNRVFWMVYTIF